jgi:lipid-A-disaccharide synthase
MKIAILAGETSGDNYGALLIDSLRKIAPEAFIFGTGGSRMKEKLNLFLEGLPYGKMGFSDVLKNIHQFYRSFKKIKGAIEEQNPTLIVFVDNPGFNLKMAQALGNKFPCFYYIPPKIWAHNYGRIKTIKRYIRGVIPIFPFEEKIYREEGILCRWFGHPVSDLLKDFSADRQADDDKKTPVIGLLPGSREEEVRYLLPVFIRIARKLSENISYEVLLSASDSSIRETEEAILKKHGTSFRILEGTPHKVIEESSLLMAACGTVNLEVALLGKPLLVFYKTSILNYLLAKIMVKLKVVSPVNLLFGERVVPEYIQQFPYGQIIEDCMDILNKGKIYMKQMERFRSIKGQMGNLKVSEEVARFFLKQVGNNKPC